MSQIVDSEVVDAAERVSPDNTIGLLPTSEAVQPEMLIDVKRLRRALTEFDAEVGDDTAALAVLEPDGDAPAEYGMLAIQEDRRDGRAVVVCGRVREEHVEGVSDA